MGLLLDILGFIDSIAFRSSYYIADSTEWCDKVWKRIGYAEHGEARLYLVGEKVYHQLYFVYEDGIEGYLTDVNDRGCNVENLNLKKEIHKELEDIGHIVIKRY